MDPLKFVGCLKDEVTPALFRELRSRAVQNVSPPPREGSTDEYTHIFHHARRLAARQNVPFTPAEFGRALNSGVVQP